MVVHGPDPDLRPLDAALPEPATLSPKNHFKLVVTAAIVAVLLLGIVAWVVAIRPKPSSSGRNAASTTALPAAQVTITAQGFEPATVKIKKGQAVTWINQDTNSHQIVSEPFPSEDTLHSLNSDAPQLKGESYTYTFEQPGTYNYLDHLNPLKLKGRVIVE